MSLSRSAVLAQHELRLMRHESSQFISLVMIPIAMAAFLSPAFAPALEDQGYDAATGAEQAIPGMVVLFTLLTASMVGYAFFREHGWHTWNRLRASHAHPLEIIMGKVAPALGLALLQQALVFAAGAVLFGLRVRGSVLAVALVCAAFALTVVAFGCLLSAFLRSTQQLNTVSNLATFALAGLGGAFAPLSTLPNWAQAAAPATPAYWAMVGFQGPILEGTGLAEAWPPVAVLLGFAAAFVALAARRFRVDETKHYGI